MNTINQVIIEGNVVRTPTTKETARGTRLFLMPVAVNRLYKDRDGNDVNEVCYFDVEAWGEKLGNAIEKCGWKGRGVRVVGRLKQSRWKTTDGKPMSKVSIIAEHVDFKPVFRKKDTDDNCDAPPEADESADSARDIENLQEAAAGLRAEQEAGETVF